MPTSLSYHYSAMYPQCYELLALSDANKSGAITMTFMLPDMDLHISRYICNSCQLFWILSE